MLAVLAYFISFFCILFTLTLLYAISIPLIRPMPSIVFALLALLRLFFIYNFFVAIFTLDGQDLIHFSLNSLKTLLYSDYHCLITSGYVIVISLNNPLVDRYRINYSDESILIVQLIYFIGTFGQNYYFFFALILEIAWLRYFFAKQSIRSNAKNEIIAWGVAFLVMQYFFRTWTFEELLLFGFMNFGPIIFYFISIYLFCYFNFEISYFIFQNIHLKGLENLDYHSNMITLIHKNKSNYFLVLCVVIGLVFNSFVFMVSEVYFENYWKTFSFISIFNYSYFLAPLVHTRFHMFLSYKK